MALIIMVIVALAWCAWLAWDGIQECRGVKSGGVNSPTPSLTHSSTHPNTHSQLPSLSDCLEVR